jgi:hypothetical protein
MYEQRPPILAVEFYRWLREAMKPMFWNDLKPTQQTEMEASFEKIKSEPTPKQERFLRSQQAAMSRAPPPGAGGAAEEEDELEAEGVEIDAFDLAEPQDVLSKVASDFHDQLASAKWKERKDALEALFVVLNVPRIKDGDYGEIARCLGPKCMKDANIAVVTQAAQCIEVLAKGMRKPFRQVSIDCYGAYHGETKGEESFGLRCSWCCTGPSFCCNQLDRLLGRDSRILEA